MIPVQDNAVLQAIIQASNQWKFAFNSGDAEACTTYYEKTAKMHAEPFGIFSGRDEIQGFWQKLIDDGFSDVEYIDPNIKIINDTSGILTAGWRMNKAVGVIHKELWVIQNDGTAKLRDDHFEAKG